MPDRPDTRDHTIDDLIKGRDAKARYLSGYSKRGFAGAAGLPSKVDLADGGRFGRADYQGRVQSCTAHAVTSMAEYIFKLSTSGDKELSRLFLYKISRELLEIDGDRGCTMRETLKALHRYGCMSEVDWPYDHYHLEKLPRITDFERARDFRSLGYARLDDYNADGERTLQNVLRTLAEGFPVAFGFSLFSSIDSMGKGKAAIIPEPPKGERGSDKSEDRVVGAHAVLAVGYEKRRNEGYLRIRNSWGEDWGDAGYAWLPFGYVTRQLACDFWTIYRIKAMDA